ncbi:MAG: tetratricopeptide repeat protein [Candidatus Freyarchaeum deiterrae]
MDSKKVKDLVNKGNEFFEQGKLEEAIHYYDEALALKPENSEALFNKGTALCELGKSREAINFFDKVLEINSQDWEALHNKGNALLNLCCFNESLECYNKALEINPKDAETIYNKGNLLLRLGRFDEAAKLFDEALALNPQMAEASLNKALALLVFPGTLSCENAISRVSAVLESLESVWDVEKLSPEVVQRFKVDVPRIMIQVIQNLAEVCGSAASPSVVNIKKLLIKILGERGYQNFIKKTDIEIHPEASVYRDILKKV